jgi:septum formation protein
MLQADAILEKMKNNGMMKEIVDSQETTLMITADQVCSLHILKRALLYNLS